jgi:hypothetical protein
MGIDVNERGGSSKKYDYLKYQWETSGFDGLEQVLIQLGKDFGYGESTKKVLVPALKEAMRPALSTAKANILAGPYNAQNVTTPHMLDTLRLNARMPSGKDKKSAYIQQNDVAMAMVSVRTDDRGMSQEFGNARTPAQPFLRRALESSAVACVDQLEMILGRRLAEYRSKQEKSQKDKTIP